MKPILYSQPEGYLVHMADFGTSKDAEYFRAKIADGASWDVLSSGDALASHDVINITKTPVRLPESTLRAGILSVLASVDVGQVSPVFDVTSKDYGVALKVAHVDAGNTPFDEVSGDIRMLLTQQEERSRLTAYEETLRKKANVVINDTELFASPVISGDNAPSADIIPIMTLDELSRDDAPESAEVAEVAESADESAKIPAIAESADDSAETTESPAIAESADETPASADTPEITESVDEMPEPVASADEIPTPAESADEIPAPAESADDKPAEPVAPASDDMPETPESSEPVADITPEVSQDISADKADKE